MLQRDNFVAQIRDQGTDLVPVGAGFEGFLQHFCRRFQSRGAAVAGGAVEFVDFLQQGVVVFTVKRRRDGRPISVQAGVYISSISPASSSRPLPVGG